MAHNNHRRFFVFLRDTFLSALHIPDHPDIVAAARLTNFCPSILDPDNVLKRLEGNEQLYFSQSSRSEHFDLSNDRYLLRLHPAERSLASDLKLKCSEYILLKRKFFHDFWRELVACKEKIGDRRKKVRTEAAHEGWLVNEYGWKTSKAKRLVVAWRVLGFLEEKRFLPWLKAGGMLEEVGWDEG